MSSIKKALLKFFLRSLVTITLLFFVLQLIDFGQLGQAIEHAKWELLIAAWGLAIAIFWIRSIRLHFIFKKLNCIVSTGYVFRASAITVLHSLILPGILSTGIKWYILKEHTSRGSNVLSSMLYNQITQMVINILVGLSAFIIVDPGGQARFVCGIITSSIIICVALLLNWRTAKIMGILIRWFLKPLPQTIKLHADRLLGQLKTFQKAGLRFHLSMTAVSLVPTVLNALLYIVAARTVEITVPALVLIWLSVTVYVLGRLPITVMNLGIREWTLVGFLGAYGVDAPSALLMSMIIFSCSIFMAAIGAAFQIIWAIRSKRPAS